MALLYACIIYDGARSVKFKMFLNSRPMYYTLEKIPSHSWIQFTRLERRESKSNGVEANMEIVSNVPLNHIYTPSK